PVLGGYHLMTFRLKCGDHLVKTRAVRPEPVTEHNTRFGFRGFRCHCSSSLSFPLTHISNVCAACAGYLPLKLESAIHTPSKRAVVSILLGVFSFDPAREPSTP